jgi:lipopolysaccharide/colanic/teichoic acid biosynthesis glycosyltransferase
MMSPSQESLKRGFDFLGAIAGSAILSPLFILVALAIKLDSQGPVLCRRNYYDLNDAVFEAFEFRTSICDAENGRLNRGANRNHYVTRMGQILRRSGLDLAPRLINVLCADMSLVGPHPLLTAASAAYRARIAPNLLRDVKPGIVSWAQVSPDRDVVAADAFRRRIEDDCYYLDHRSFLFDMKILLLVLLMKSTYS